MKELFTLAFSFKLKQLLIEPTDNVSIQTFRALIVGGLSFIADAGLLWLISLTGLHYLVCAIFGFLLGVYVNYILSVMFVFKQKAVVGKLGEIVIYLIIGTIGLAMTAGIMWLFTEIVGLFYMVSKVIATLIVFIWNFVSRKVFLYKEKKD